MPGLLAQKIGMTRLLKEDGSVVPVTVVRVAPNTVMQVKTKERDGYDAVVLGILKPRTDGHTVTLYSAEFKIDGAQSYTRGQVVTVADFSESTSVFRVTGTSKGKGFQGAMKRHNFHGHPASHGAQYHRTIGSVGTRKPRRVKPGKRMAGHMGSDTITLRGVPIEKIDADHQLLALRGALPGAINSYVKIELTPATVS